jgi:8-oxo-dGTP pyrophosphatase MutT (NUDIX family)
MRKGNRLHFYDSVESATREAVLGRAATEPKDIVQQYAALPFAVRDGELLVLLVTTRGTGRWIIPKGNPEKNLKPYEVAKQEAFEEAGVTGRVHRTCFGRFEFAKSAEGGESALCAVDVYPLAVDQELDDWPEKGMRQREWMTPGQAAMRVTEPGLIDLFLNMSGFIDEAP